MRSRSLKVASSASRLQAISIDIDLDIYGLRDEKNALRLFAWLSPAELEYLSTPPGELDLNNFLSFIDFVDSDDPQGRRFSTEDKDDGERRVAIADSEDTMEDGV